MAKYSSNNFDNKSKFIIPKGERIGHIELRTEKSERNMAKSRKRALDRKKYKDVTDRFTSKKDYETHDPDRRKY